MSVMYTGTKEQILLVGIKLVVKCLGEELIYGKNDYMHTLLLRVTLYSQNVNIPYWIAMP